MTVEPICFSCKHFAWGEKKGVFRCAAFDSIPDEILFGKNYHQKPLPEQKNNIVFEPTEEAKKILGDDWKR